MVDAADVLADLVAESSDVDSRVAGLAAAEWATPTPAAGWTIAHQVAHLAWTDDKAIMAITDQAAFAAHVAEAAARPDSIVDDGATSYLDEPAALLARWRAGRQRLAEHLEAVPAGIRIPWYATAMTPASLATARLMETWAHGLDIADALGIAPAPTARLRHIAFLGHRTLGYAFLAHGRPAPATGVRVVLEAPDGTQWTFGPEDAADRVTGPGLDFCYLVTQRRHRDDLALVATGPVANEWLDVAQAFAGQPGAGRPPQGAPA
jgi:uncharacterized protein (TIGR03084 family)